MVPETLQTAEIGQREEGIHRVRGCAARRRFLPQRQTHRTARERCHGRRLRPHPLPQLQRGKRDRRAGRQRLAIPRESNRQPVPMERPELQCQLRGDNQKRVAAHHRQIISDITAIQQPANYRSLCICLRYKSKKPESDDTRRIPNP